ncbi:MAG: hypothetical protein IJM79_06170 [Erysipelotrichaceae bacterium]|nr:hypothetical protein [Erysipelotrichaceae bacterium]
MKLIEPSMEYAEQILEYRREFLEAGDSMAGAGSLKKCETPEEWIRKTAASTSPQSSNPTAAVHCSAIGSRFKEKRIFAFFV